ncbi:WYL domain-containing protein [Pilimelia anulata]|uniref:WYL domain-containing protein n=1 Tax=Pilimelia anulata TaxID=53371 RepID=A0A8J3BE49_9ACTN|nr:WYL domain-containing protein [Pilimelia anulata]GGK01928.1 WYL domain-containing protein [Pilimelia anulata]
MSRNRTERLVNLVICLLSTRRFLTAAQIAATVPGYEHDGRDPKQHEAFQRKFERDKSELRDLGVPLEMGTTSVFDTEQGYRIAHREYALPEVRLAADEAAAVGIAARLWQHAGLAAAASSGLAKLRAAGIDVDDSATVGLEPLVTVDPAFAPLTAAARARRAVTFTHRVPSGDAPTARRLQPWGLVCWRGRWYVVGHDLDRAATRCFRLSRIVGPVRPVGEPGAYERPDVDLLSQVRRWSGAPERSGEATVWARAGRAAGLRRWARSAAPAPGGDRLTLSFADVDSFAGYLAGFGADVRVVGPPELRDAVIGRLKEIVAGSAA